MGGHGLWGLADSRVGADSRAGAYSRAEADTGVGQTLWRSLGQGWTPGQGQTPGRGQTLGQWQIMLPKGQHTLAAKFQLFTAVPWPIRGTCGTPTWT